MRNATMRDPRGLLRKKRFEASSKPRTIALIGTMIKDCDNMIAKLDKMIAAQENCTRIRDTKHCAYSILAKAMGWPRQWESDAKICSFSAEQMKSMLDVLRRQYLVVALPVAQSRANPELPATDSR